MKVYKIVEIYFRTFLSFSAAGDVSVFSNFGCLTPGAKSVGSSYIGGSASPRTSVNAAGEG
jgi:hypothetical protein